MPSGQAGAWPLVNCSFRRFLPTASCSRSRRSLVQIQSPRPREKPRIERMRGFCASWTLQGGHLSPGVASNSSSGAVVYASLTVAYSQLRAIRLAAGEWGKSDKAWWA